MLIRNQMYRFWQAFHRTCYGWNEHQQEHTLSFFALWWLLLPPTLVIVEKSQPKDIYRWIERYGGIIINLGGRTTNCLALFYFENWICQLSFAPAQLSHGFITCYENASTIDSVYNNGIHNLFKYDLMFSCFWIGFTV
jgi:hypothetical protein